MNTTGSTGGVSVMEGGGAGGVEGTLEVGSEGPSEVKAESLCGPMTGESGEL